MTKGDLNFDIECEEIARGREIFVQWDNPIAGEHIDEDDYVQVKRIYATSEPDMFIEEETHCGRGKGCFWTQENYTILSKEEVQK